jgi:hypothetical protein
MFVEVSLLLLLGIGLGYLIGRRGSHLKSLQDSERIVHPGLAPEYHGYSPAPRFRHDLTCRTDPRSIDPPYRNWPR